LRRELQAAWEGAQGERLRFRVSDVSLTVQAVATRERQASGKVRWWLIEGGGEAKRVSESTQTLVLSLTPGIYDEQGRAQPLDVYGEQPMPGG
jgi:Trypsin-co-occurring domain 2